MTPTEYELVLRQHGTRTRAVESDRSRQEPSQSTRSPRAMRWTAQVGAVLVCVLMAVALAATGG